MVASKPKPKPKSKAGAKKVPKPKSKARAKKASTLKSKAHAKVAAPKGFKKLHDRTWAEAMHAWKAPQVGAPEALARSLEHRRRTEQRFLHKVLQWPTFYRHWDGQGRRGTIKRRQPLGAKPPAKGTAWDVGWERYLHTLRTQLYARAKELGADLARARHFDAQADMARSRGVWMIDAGDIDYKSACAAFVRADGSEERLLACPETCYFGPVALGPEPEVDIWDPLTREVGRYKVEVEDECRPREAPGWPPFLARQVGMTNAPPPQPAAVLSAGPATDRAELLALEQRLEAYRVELARLTGHGYDMVWYGRSGLCQKDNGRYHAEVAKERARVEQERPQHVDQYHAAWDQSQAKGDAVFAEFSCAHYMSQLLGAYLGGQSACSAPDGTQVDEPEELMIANFECEEPPSLSATLSAGTPLAA